MIQCVCDICGKEPASKRFKVKELGRFLDGNKWVKIDICSNCYHKLLDAQEHLGD